MADIYSPVAAYEHILTSNPDDRDLLKRCNISEYIETNLFIDSMKTAMSKEEMLNSLPLANGAVISGQKIIDKGEIVDEKHSISCCRTRRKSTNANIIQDYRMALKSDKCCLWQF